MLHTDYRIRINSIAIIVDDDLETLLYRRIPSRPVLARKEIRGAQKEGKS